MHYGYPQKYPTYTSFTSYINSDNSLHIAQTITNLLTQERGYYLLPRLPYLAINIEKLDRRYWSARPPLLIVALASGRNGWAVVRTYPSEWLFLRANSIRPRLSDISIKLKCNAFYYRVIHDADNLLMEVNSKGDFKFNFNRFPQFSLIDVPESFFKTMEIAKEKPNGGYFYRDECSGELITIKLAELINSYQDRWDGDDLYYMVYQNAKRLKAMNIKLLYFLPPDDYLRTLPRYNDEPDDHYDLLQGHWYESPF